MKQQNNGSKQNRRLTAEKKWRIYQEFQQPDAKSGEILRKNSIYSSDLQTITKAVQERALERLRQSQPVKAAEKAVDCRT